MERRPGNNSRSCLRRLISRHQQRRQRRAYAGRQTVFFKLGNMRAGDYLHRRPGDLEHTCCDRILQQACQGVLTRRAHHNLRDAQALRHAIYGLGTITQFNVCGVRYAMLFKQRTSGRQSAFRQVPMPGFAIAAAGKLRYMLGKRRAHV